MLVGNIVTYNFIISVREVFTQKILFGKVDIDTIVASYLAGARPNGDRPILYPIPGSACGKDLKNKRCTCIEVGGSGQSSRNNFDHHIEGFEHLSATFQYFLRFQRLAEYVQQLDVGKKQKYPKVDRKAHFPSLVWLVSGLLLSESDPRSQMEQGLRLIEAIIQMGIDPFASMLPLLAVIPEAKTWIEKKRKHEKKSTEECQKAQWLKTSKGKSLAVVKTSWIGVPGALHGRGADIVVVLNPNYSAGGATYVKLTISSKLEPLSKILKIIDTSESGWGGLPSKGIISSPRGVNSQLTLEMVAKIVQENM